MQGCLKASTTKKGRDAPKHAQKERGGMPINMHNKEGQGSLKTSTTKKSRDASKHPQQRRARMPQNKHNKEGQGHP